MKSPFHHIRHAHKTFEHFHKNLHHAFVLIVGAIIGMLRGASHILTPATTTATRTWGGFITSDFWEQHPSNGNIQYALFGNETPGSTAYTRLRDAGCTSSMNIITLPSLFNGQTLYSNTIYIIESGNYTLTSPIAFDNETCSALIGKGDVTINMTGNNNIYIVDSHEIIVDNIKANGQSSIETGAYVSNSSNITLNTMNIYQTNFIGLFTTDTNINITNSMFYNNSGFGAILFMETETDSIQINNSQFYNNNILGLYTEGYQGNITINNSQFYNNSGYTLGGPYYFGGALFFGTSGAIIHNSLFYNNKSIGLGISDGGTFMIHNSKFYNNQTGLFTDGTGLGYGTLEFLGNNYDILSGGGTFSLGNTSPVGLGRQPGQFITGTATIDYNQITNPQNNNGQWLLSGNDRNTLRGIQGFTPTHPIRYIFGENVLKQQRPVRYNGTTLAEYGNNGSDYITTRYIAEPESSLSLENQTLVEQYFGSESAYTENRETNGCSLSAFQVKILNTGNFSTTYNFEDHTIYILTGGEYRYTASAGNGFEFNGNCIAIIGNDDTRFTKSGGGGTTSILYANNKRNIIIDNVKVDGYYYGTSLPPTGPAAVGIKLNGNTNNSTLNDIQIYNTAQYGIYFGFGSHHNTILNGQLFNNISAGIYLYYTSNYNVINNTQTYNNGHGIRFANGSSRNAMNNFQSYNNTIGVFGDQTTQENIINRAAIYNNSQAGISFKNSSGNILNDVMLYNNTIGINTLYSSLNNSYYGELKLFSNGTDFDGTNGNDSYLSPGNSGIFPYGGNITTGTIAMSCIYATNPTRSGDSYTLLNNNCSNRGITGFLSPYDTYINYMFGLNMYKQKVPVKYVSGSTQPVEITSQYDDSKYIAEFFAIRDDEPENVMFDFSGTIALNTRHTTNIYTAGTLNISVPVSLNFDPVSTSGYLIISGTNVGLSGTVHNDDTIQIAVLTPNSYATTITGSITIGAITTPFTITTRNLNQIPDTGSFAFTNFTSMPINTFTGSTVTVSGIETGVYAGIIFEPNTTSGRLEIYSGTNLMNSGTTGLLLYNGYKIKAIGQSSSGYAQTITGHITIGLGTGDFTITTKGSDITSPTPPILTYPLSGEELFFITRERTAATDTGSGIEGYVYEIAEDISFIDIVDTGFIATVTGTMGRPDSDFDETDDIYYRRLQARDRDGNVSPRSTIGEFEVIDIDGREFDEKDNTNLMTYYESNTITLDGIKPGLSLRASVDNNGVLYENNDEQGTGSYVQNDDELHVTIRSSNTYDDSKSTTLTLANRTLEFIVTTKEEGNNECTISDEDKEIIQGIFDNLVNNYSGNENMYEEFLYTMQSMLEDEIDFTNDCNLDYLQGLIEEALGITDNTGTGTHIAPNCKEYLITYNEDDESYTSPNLSQITYFANRDSLTKYIDSKNPGDCHINTYGVSSRVFTNTNPSKHIASNGKIYFITMESGKYTSNTFMYKKYFTSLAELRSYIDSKNPPPNIWNHFVDTSFTPQIYTAPNSKEYKIYKTNKGYMSYKLMKVQYFSSLTELQSYISRNNSR